jgi:hypothetical protein
MGIAAYLIDGIAAAHGRGKELFRVAAGFQIAAASAVRFLPDLVCFELVAADRAEKERSVPLAFSVLCRGDKASSCGHVLSLPYQTLRLFLAAHMIHAGIIPQVPDLAQSTSV